MCLIRNFKILDRVVGFCVLSVLGGPPSRPPNVLTLRVPVPSFGRYFGSV